MESDNRTRNNYIGIHKPWSLFIPRLLRYSRKQNIVYLQNCNNPTRIKNKRRAVSKYKDVEYDKIEELIQESAVVGQSLPDDRTLKMILARLVRLAKIKKLSHTEESFNEDDELDDKTF